MAEKKDKKLEKKPTSEEPEKVFGQVTLSNGDLIVFDFYQLKRKDYDRFRSLQMTDEESSEMIARVTGLTIEYLADLNWIDWRRLMNAFHEYIMAPVSAYPNSASGSISD